MGKGGRVGFCCLFFFIHFHFFFGEPPLFVLGKCNNVKCLSR